MFHKDAVCTVKLQASVGIQASDSRRSESELDVVSIVLHIQCSAMVLCNNIVAEQRRCSAVS